MPLRIRFLLAAVLIVLVALLAMVFSPFAVSNAVRWWVWWKASQEGLIANIDKIDAPFLRPIVIRGFHLTSAPGNVLHIDLTATQTTVGLNFKRILLHTHGHAIRDLSIQGLHGELRQSNPGGRAITQHGWITLHKLLPQNLSIASSDLRLENGATVILLRDILLSASETEAGRFRAGEVMIASPWFRQTFSNLRGATNWQENRLTLAGLTLTRGLDVQSITANLSRLGNQRVGLEFDTDAFGGKIRANISHQWRPSNSNWKIAGSASDISLAQTSEAIGFTDRVDGLLRACNFTFRGSLSDAGRATASLWSELTGLSWRGRTAEAIMIGAALYNRQVQLQQLYIKQKTNQLTLSGEASFPSNSAAWLNPDFRGDISAAINQLGDFAALFGANAGDFAGKIAIEGTMNARDRKIGGHLVLDGASVTLFKTAIDNLNAKLTLKATELEIEQFDLKRKNDFLTAQGKIDMSHVHNYSGTINATVGDLADYLSIFRGPAENKAAPMPAKIQATIESSKWDVEGTIGLSRSSALGFTANFLLPIGMDWNAFLESPLNIAVEFPSIFLANAPQLFHPEIFRDGILSGSLSLSETLGHPQITGHVQLIDGKLADAPCHLTEASGRLTFSGNTASLDFLNTATKDVDLSLRGEIDFHDPNALLIKVKGATPIFDLTARPIDCVSKIEINPIAATLAPAVAELELRGGLSRWNWTMGLKEQSSTQTPTGLNLSGTDRTFPLCLNAGSEEKTLFLGAPPRPEAVRETVRPKKRTKRR